MFRRRHPRDPGISPVVAGLVALTLVALGTYFGFSRANPFSSPYTFQAVFADAMSLKTGAAVRIAGINVGKVKSVEAIDPGKPAGRAEIELEEKALPIHSDATIQLRPRIFLEGNLFLDLKPGSPQSPKLPEHGVLPSTQTSGTVKFSDVLAALQSDTRKDLQTLLVEYAKATEKGGATAFNRSIEYWAPAYRYGSLANQATLGEEPHDLSGVVKHQQKVFRALSRNEAALKDLVVQLNTTIGAFAREDLALERTVPALRETLRVGVPALRSLNSSLPSLRRFAVDALPGARNSDEALAASTPFIRQARQLVSARELKGLVSDLRVTIPGLAKLNAATIPFLEESRSLSACQTKVLVPFATTPIPDPDFPDNSDQPFYKQAPRGLVGLSGEGRIHDSNTPMFHADIGGGPTTFIETNDIGTNFIGTKVLPPLGVRPANTDVHPVYRPNVPCETQQAADLNAPAGPTSSRLSRRQLGRMTPELAAADRRLKALLARESEHVRLQQRGIHSIDPFSYHGDLKAERRAARQLGYVKNAKGVYVPKAAVGK